MRHYEVNRRSFIKGAALTSLGLTLSACVPPSAPTSVVSEDDQAPMEEIVLQWWDHYGNLPELQREIWDGYIEEHPNVTVEHTLHTPADVGRALQLAFPNGQAPDVHSTAGIGVPAARLVADGWFTPIGAYASQEWAERFPPGTLVPGLTVFDGEIYSFPIFSFRYHETLLWYNRELVEAAGYDPEIGPRTWDEFREYARTITETGGGNIFGWIQGIQFVDRLAAHVTNLAKAAGAPGTIDWRTGEYVYASEPFLQAIELLVSMAQDGSLLPGSSSLNARTARARWVTGIAGLFMDGPWNVGTIAREFPEFLDKIGVNGIPVPSLEQPVHIPVGPEGGAWWISSQSEHPDVAAAILENYNTDAFYVGVAEMMTPPPVDLSAVDRANVHPTYQEAIDHYLEVVRLAPEPSAFNPNVSEVLARMNDVRPHLGEITQGAITGDIEDWRTAVQDYNDKMTAEREQAIEAANADGIEISIDAWVFSDWDRTNDYIGE